MLCCRIILALLFASLVMAEEADRADQIVWGKHLEGPTVGDEDLKGRAVLLVMWAKDMPSLEWIRKVGPLRERYGDKLVIIASHWMEQFPQGILDTWSMVEGGEHIPLMVGTHRAGDLRPLPELVRDRGRRLAQLGGALNAGYDRACLLYDHTGRLVVQDNIEAVTQRIPEVYKAAIGHLPGDRAWSAFAKEAAILGEADRSMAASLRSIRKTLEEVDMVKMEEAQALLDRVVAWATRERAEIDRLRSVDATVCLLRLNTVAALLQGDELGEPFAELLKELKKDKAFMASHRAEEVLRSLRQDANSMALADNPEQAKSNKSYLARIQRMEKTLKDILAGMPGSGAAGKAQAMLSAYGL
jgi:hypothetical protein